MSIGGSTFLGVTATVYGQATGVAVALASAEFLGAEVLPLAEIYSEEVPENGEAFRNLVAGYRGALENQNRRSANEAQKNMAALLRQTAPDVWKNIVGKLETHPWATSGGLFATPAAEQTLKRYGVEPTPFNLRMYQLGLEIEGRKIAVDLDGTLIDYAKERTSIEGEYRLTVQVKAGAEALILGLARHNALLLYTVRDARQVEAIFARSDAFQKSFSEFYTLEDWIEVMTEIVSKGLEHPETLTPFEQKVLGLFEKYRQHPKSLMHLKHPELARRRGKIDFEVIVGDDPIAELLDLAGGNAKQIYLRPRRYQAGAVDIPEVADNELFQVAEILRCLDEVSLTCIGSVDFLEGEPLRRFVTVIHDSSYLEPKMQHLESLRRRWLARSGTEGSG